MLRVIVAGVFGKMGLEIVRQVREEPEMMLVGAFERPDHPRVGEEVVEGVTVAGSLEEVIEKGDVFIDFTHHTASVMHLHVAEKHRKRAVVGTTGFTPSELDEIQQIGRKIPMVFAPNMSVGVNLLFKLVKEAAEVLGPAYDIEIVEAHHRLKKDAPSGTAMRLGEILARTAKNAGLEEVGVFSRQGMIGARSDREIGIQTVRAGDIVGEHTVLFAGPGERVELTHRAHNRSNFAAGAVKAALWLSHQPVGLYDMQDVLGLK